MLENIVNYPVLIFMIGILLILVMFIKPGLQRIGIPPLVGFLVLGIILRTAGPSLGLYKMAYAPIMDFMGRLGLITLLFKVGLESNIHGLLSQLRRASVVMSGNIVIVGVLTYAVTFYILGLGWGTSLITSTAITATSVGISVAVWEEAGAIKTQDGELLIDVAELDDITAILLMSLIFSILPVLDQDAGGSIAQTIFKVLGLSLLKLMAFGALCLFFSRNLERKMSGFFRNLEPAPDFMLTVAGIGFVIAAVADLMGFSLAIGAFFAGLVFSRDPDAIKFEASFIPIYELFSPFFFIGIGLEIDPSTFSNAFGIGSVLVVTAILTKIIGNGLPLWFLEGPKSALLIGVSMIPRAEIALVITHQGYSLGKDVIPPSVFGAMVLVSAVTCLFSPIMVRHLLRRWAKEIGTRETS